MFYKRLRVSFELIHAVAQFIGISYLIVEKQNLTQRGTDRRMRSVQRLGVGYGHGVQHLVQQLQGPVQVDLDPAWGLLDALPRVIGAPAFHKAHAQDAQPAQVIHADASGRRQT